MTSFKTDDTLSTESTNAVQNSTITAKLNELNIIKFEYNKETQILNIITE